MKTRPLAWAVAIAAAVPFLAVAPRASADQITMTLQNGGDQFGGGPFSWKVTSGSTTPHIAAGSSLTTYCADVFHHIATGGSYNYSLSNATTAPSTFTNGNGTDLTPAQMTQVRDLFGEGFKNGGTPSDTTAFQLALWKLEYGNTSTYVNNAFGNAGSGLLANTNALIAAVNADVTNHTNAFANNLAGYSLYFLCGAANCPQAQNQITLVPGTVHNPVPAPPAAVLAAFGLIALGGRASWLRKKPVA